MRRPFWTKMTRRKVSAARLPPSALLLVLVVTTSLRTLPRQEQQVKISMSGRSRKLDSNAKECEKRMLHSRKLQLRSSSLAMSCMLKAGEMKSERAAVTAEMKSG